MTWRRKGIGSHGIDLVLPEYYSFSTTIFNILRPRQNGRRFADDVFKSIFLCENVWNLIKISLKFVPKGQINNIPSLVQIMAWRRPGDKPLSEAMMVSLLMHICITPPQWVKKQQKKVTLWDTGLVHCGICQGFCFNMAAGIWFNGKKFLTYMYSEISWFLNQESGNPTNGNV